MSRSIFTIFGAVIFASFLAVNGKAQSPASEAVSDSLELDRIVITASKIPMPQRETTKPVQVIDRAEIERNSGRDLSQILNQQSGIRVNDSYGSPSNGRILYMQGAAATNTLILVDGLAVNDPSGVGGLFDLRLLPTNNIERIEVIKGSQSTLYGTDAIAGVINIITRDGGQELINGTGQISYGSFNSFRGNVGANGSAGDLIKYSFHYNRESSDGFSAAKNPGNIDESFGDDGYTLDSFYGKAALEVSDFLQITPFLKYSKNTGDYDGGAFSDANNTFTLEMFHPGVQAVAEFGDLRLNGGYNFTRTNRLFASQFGESDFEGRFHNADIFGTYRISNQLQVLGGFNYQDFIIPEVEDAAPGRNAQISSPYVTVYLKNLNGFSTELGGRLNNHSEYGNNSTFSIAPAWELNDQLKLFGSVSTGFKAPTLDELFGTYGAADLDPQKSLYYNIGAESYLFGQSLKLSAQYFNREIEDLIIFSPDGYVNRDRQNDQGIELTADWIVSGTIRAGAWYNYLDGEVLTQNAEGEEVIESNLIRRPAHSIGLSAGIQVADPIFIRLDGEYNGERTDLFFNPDFVSEDVTLDPYILVNLYAEYKFYDKKFTLFGDVKNLLNSDFTEVYGFNTMGTAVKAGLRVDF